MLNILINVLFCKLYKKMKLMMKFIVIYVFVFFVSISCFKLKSNRKNNSRWAQLDEVLSSTKGVSPKLTFSNISEFDALVSELGLDKKENEFKFKKAMKNNDFKLHPTVVSGLFLLKNFNLLNDKNLIQKASVLAKIEYLYRPVPYHNKYHPADMLLRLNRWLSNDRFKALKTINKKEVQIVLESLVYAIAGHDAYHPGVKNSEVCRPSIQDRMKSNIKKDAQNICHNIGVSDESTKLTLEVVHSYMTNSILVSEKDNLPKEIFDSAQTALKSISIRNHNFVDLNYAKGSDTSLKKLAELELIDSCITATDYMVSLNLKNNDTEMEKLTNYDWSKSDDKDFIDNLKQLARYLVITLDISNTGSNHVKRSISFSLSVMSEFGFGANKIYKPCEIIEEQKLNFFFEYFEKISKVLNLSDEENLLKNLKLNHYYLFRKFEKVEKSDENSIDSCKNDLIQYFDKMNMTKLPYENNLKNIPDAGEYIKRMKNEIDTMLSNKNEVSSRK